jgi:hypothetical protein
MVCNPSQRPRQTARRLGPHDTARMATLDQGLREILTEEIELAAQRKGRILQLKSVMGPPRRRLTALLCRVVAPFNR